MSEAERLQDLVGREVVLDVEGPTLYVGTLASVDEWFFELTDADVHDRDASNTTRDVYIINVRKYGIKKNRDRVLVRRSRVVSLSLLSDVTAY